MNFAEVLTKPFLLSHEGRINRQRYWAFAIIYIAALIVAEIIDAILGTGIISFLVILVALYPSICVTIKRWHDRDKSGWWILIGLIPVIGAIWAFIECGCLAGTQGPNRFGADPLAGSEPVVV
jgi:uncharacterized membrane protein YhaH (DUF805 family)